MGKIEEEAEGEERRGERREHRSYEDTSFLCNSLAKFPSFVLTYARELFKYATIARDIDIDCLIK